MPKVILAPAEREEYEERAGIMEFDGGLRREDAEEMALAMVLAKRQAPGRAGMALESVLRGRHAHGDGFADGFM